MIEKHLKLKTMKKSEIKNEIVNLFSLVSNEVLNEQLVLTTAQTQLYEYFKSLVSKVDNYDVTKQNLIDLHDNFKSWGIKSILGYNL